MAREPKEILVSECFLISLSYVFGVDVFRSDATLHGGHCHDEEDEFVHLACQACLAGLWQWFVARQTTD